jgi:hypothetical protein
MAIAFDAESASTADLASGANHSHAGAAGARAAIVCIADSGASTQRVTGVTYAGVSMAQIQFNSDTSELGTTSIWWLDGITGGTQNVVVTHSGAIRIAVYTVTVAALQNVAVDANTGADTTTTANPAWNMTTTASTTTFCAEVLHSGLQTMTTTPATNWTAATTTNLDRGAIGWGAARRSPLPTGGVVACGWTAATSDDWCGSSAAFKEVAPPAATPSLLVRRRNRQANHRAAPGLTSR